MKAINKLNSLKKYLKKNISKKRYYHILSVKKTAVYIALKLSKKDIEKSIIASLAHDLTKEWSFKRHAKYIKDKNIDLDDFIKDLPQLHHCFSGAQFLKDRFKIKNKDILNAIKYHSIGYKDMTELQKIIFIADYIEDSRKGIKDLQDEIKSILLDDKKDKKKD